MHKRLGAMNPSVISAHAEAIDALSLSTCVAMVMFALGKPRVGAVALFSIAALPFRMELAAPHGAAPQRAESRCVGRSERTKLTVAAYLF
ncbi:hypothetical protein WT60_18430 [Burkholderia sp. MSMB617WGS]|nr:hypothetical protein WT60_18430 [Burkholderia sp. MSMB617WGS]